MTDHDDASLAATALAAPAPAPEAQAATPDASAGPVGKTIKARYKIKRLLGEGGMGGVYEGEHLEIGKRVAIKLVHSLHARDAHVAARIKQEARSTSAIESEHIVQVFDAGEDEELGLFLVMELLKGEDLGKILARKKRLGQTTAAALIAQAATGLARAHSAGIVHRDLKPANVFVVTRDDGSSLVKLVDFGIAKVLRDAQAHAHQGSAGLTRMGMVIGTPQYMSPEQAQGLPTVDHRTDVYSLGAVLFEAIVGQSPFREMPTYEQTILQIMTRPAPRIAEMMPDVHPELDRLCAEMMAMDPLQRPQDMAAVRERIYRIFPELEHSRAPMKSLTNEMAFEATAFAGQPLSGEALRIIEAARVPASGQGVASQRSPTNSAMSVSYRGDRSEIDEAIAGVPQRRKVGGIVAAVSAVVVLAILGGVAVVKMSGPKSDEKAQAGYGLVQSTVAATVVSPSPPSPVPPSPEPQKLAPAVAPIAPVAAQPAAKPARGAHEHEAAPRAAHSGAKEAKPSAPARAPEATLPAADPAPAARPVGGTGVSTEF